MRFFRHFLAVLTPLLMLLMMAGASFASASLTISSASVGADGRSLTINVTGIGTSPLLPATGAAGFSVKDATSGVTQTVTTAVEGASAVTATLAYQINPADSVTISYAPGTLTDSAGTPNTMAAQGPVTVTNNSSASPPNLTQIAAGNFASVPGLKAWYRADAGTFTDAAKSAAATTDGQLVYTWANQVSGGIDAVQATSGSRPSLKLAGNGINGHATIHFSGAQGIIATSLFASDTASSATVFVVGVPKAATATNAVLWISGSSPRWDLFYPSSAVVPATTLINLETGSGAGTYGPANSTWSAFSTTYSLPLDNTTNVMSLRSDGSRMTFSANRHERGGTQAGLVPSGDLSIGTKTTSFLNGDISEIIVCNQAVSDTVRRAIENALIAKYQVALTKHTVLESDSILAQPAEATGYAGQANPLLTGVWYNEDVSAAGRPLSDMLANISTRVLATYTPARPRTVVDIGGGTNDIVGGSSQTIPNTVAGGDALYAEMVSYCRIVKGAGFRVKAHTILPRDGQGVARLEFNTQLRNHYAEIADGIVDAAADPIIGDNGKSDSLNNNHNGKVSINTLSTGQPTANFPSATSVAPFAAGQQVQLLGGTPETMTVSTCSTTSVTFTSNVANASHTSVQLAVSLAAYSTGQPTIAFTSTQPSAPYFPRQQVQFLGGTAETLTVSTCSTTSVTFTANIANTGHTSLYQVDNYIADAVHPTLAGAIILGAYVASANNGTAYGSNPTQPGVDNGLFAGAMTAGSATGTTIPLTWAAATGGTGPYSYQAQLAPNVVSSDGVTNYDTPGTFVNNGASTTSLSKTITGLTASTSYWTQVKVTDSTGTPIVNISNISEVATAATSSIFRRTLHSRRPGARPALQNFSTGRSRQLARTRN